MKARILLSLLIALPLGFFGCSTASRFEMNTEIFLTAEEALSAHDNLLDEIDQKIVRRASPAVGQLLVITPTKQIVRERGVEVETGAPESDIEYTTQVLFDDNEHFATFIEIAGLAGQVVREKSDNPKARAEGMKSGGQTEQLLREGSGNLNTRDETMKRDVASSQRPPLPREKAGASNGCNESDDSNTRDEEMSFDSPLQRRPRKKDEMGDQNSEGCDERSQRDYGAVVYLDIISPSDSGWYLIKMPGNTTTQIEFGSDDSNSRYPKIGIVNLV